MYDYWDWSQRQAPERVEGRKGPKVRDGIFGDAGCYGETMCMLYYRHEAWLFPDKGKPSEQRQS